jgi:leucyl-tRNA synthetase
MAVQVNGKLRAAIVAPKDADKDAVIAIAMKEERVAASLEG